MKKAHFQYIGYPRSGSTFLHRVFQKQSQLNKCTNNFIKEFYCNDFEEYVKSYSMFDYSINMFTQTLMLKRVDYLQMTDSVTDKFFACIRNPYDAFSSSFTLWNGHKHTDSVKYRFSDYANSLKLATSVITKPFKIFYFDDLVANQNNFVSEICNFLEIETPVIDLTKILKHKSSDVYHDLTDSKISDTGVAKGASLKIRQAGDIIPQCSFSDSEIEYFNKKITDLEHYLDRDFSHWKR